MTKKLLLIFVGTALFGNSFAQKKQQQQTGYAITASAKGASGWKEIRQIDAGTGEVIKTVYEKTSTPEILNARTGKAVQKKDNIVQTGAPQQPTSTEQLLVIDNDRNTRVVTNRKDFEQFQAAGYKTMIVRHSNYSAPASYDNPFATNSAACAYDKKHERLYYTPMGINQLRYIDLKTSKIYYFEDEAFGNVKGQWDGPNQITRMVIASDGNGYALTNDANHLIRFTTGKKPEITDLGALTDKNEKISIHSGMGGDMVADKDGNLYLITAFSNVFKINIENKTSEYKGGIKGLPENYRTNGAMVEAGSSVIVCSSESTEAYYRFDLNTLQSEKIAGNGNVYNASDLANGNLASVKEEKKEKPEEAQKTVIETAKQQQAEVANEDNYSISVFPNPVIDGVVKLAMNNLPAGKYRVQVLDISGRVVLAKDMQLAQQSKGSLEEIRLPSLSKGTYLVKVTGSENTVSASAKIIVE